MSPYVNADLHLLAVSVVLFLMAAAAGWALIVGW